MKKYDKYKMKLATEVFLEALGIDWKNDPQTKDTPERASKMWEILLGGCDIDPKDYIVTFPAKSQDIVTLTNVPIYSFCAHHLLPYIGKIHIAYKPKDKVIGLSKLIRFSRMCAKNLSIQEDLTADIADSLMKHIDAEGVIVKVEASHFCIILRGVRSQGSVMTTIAKRGVFAKDSSLVNEFENSIRDQGVFPY